MADDSIDFGDIAQAAVAIAVAYAAQAALNSLNQPKQASVSQTFPSQLTSSAAYIMVGGKSRIPGLTVLKDVNGNQFGTIQAFHDGRVADPDGYYLNEDFCTVDGSGWVTAVQTGGTPNTDGRYVDQKVKILHRNGLPTETAISEFVSLFSAIWTTNHRGDGTATAGMICVSPKAKFVSQAFPGGLPTLNIVTQPADIYDWRQDSTQPGGSGSQRRDDPSTWSTCENYVINRVHLEWYRWGRSWDRCIAPVLADLTAEANVCDEAVTLSAGGTEPRYRCAGWYVDSDTRGDIRKKLDATADGFVTTDGRGRLIVKAGHYEEPTFVLTSEYIEDYSWSRGVSRDVRVSSFSVTFTDPGSDYSLVNCDPWVIDESGGKPLPLALDWVPSFTQARRLAKRAAARANPAYTGQIKTGPYGFNGMGQRYIRVQNPAEASMADVVCEVTNVEFDPITGQVVFDVISADSNIDAWNPATEEGNPVAAVVRPDPGALTAPTIEAVTPFYDGSNVRLKVTTTGPARDDLTWSARWRVTGATSWNEGTYPDAVPISGGQVYLNTGVVILSTSLDVETFYYTAGGSPSPYSSTFTVNSYVVPPSWADPGALWQAELTSTSNRFWTGDTEYASLAAAISASKATYSRASAVWARNAAAAYTSIASGVVAMTDYGALIEPSATNSALYSDTMSNAVWVAGNGTKTAGQTTPFGSDGALYTGGGTSAVHYMRQAGMTIVSGNGYTITAWVKAGTADRVQLTLDQGFSTAQYSNFYLNGAGSVTATGTGSSNSIRLENGWYILTHTATASGASANGTAYLSPLVTGSETRLTTFTSSATFTLGHLALGPTAEGSPITTTSSPVTRAATALLFKPVPGTYDITLTMGDDTTTTLSAVAITTGGWTVPTALNRYVKKIVATA